jgi:adenosylmethionine-8-amino-7-oxononanoate aminotransferase
MDNLEFDKKHLWHPYTSTTKPSKTHFVESANGCEIILQDGTKLIDGMASWWSAIHGYSHPKLVEAVQKQAEKMSHIMFGGLTHEPAIELGKKLLSFLPKEFQHIFFADSGSVSVEVAMKTAIQFQFNKNLPKRNRFLTVLNGYHGDTTGAMSVCDPINGMHSLFSGSIQKQFFASAPPMGFEREITDENFAEIMKIAEENQDEIAAIILEPIVQGAGGMRIYSPQYLQRVRKLCDKYGFLLIFDEIATGFGRTGKMFAFEHAGVFPDIICVGKALTGGMMTLAAMITTGDVAKIACKDGMFLMHGPTFMANPLACAAAKANLDLLTSWNWQEKVLFIEKYLKENLMPLKSQSKVADVRVLGAIGVVEMKENIDIQKFQDTCISKGAWLRPFGKLAYVMPPYIITEEEFEKLVKAFGFAVA